MAEAIEKSLNALTIKIDNFDGSDSCDPQQFVDSLNRYLETTGKVSPDLIQEHPSGRWVRNPRKGVLEKEILRMHLKGEAKSWFKNMDPTLSYRECCDRLVQRFKLTDQQKHARKLEVFQMKQRAGETYSAYVSRVCEAASVLKLDDKELLTIVTQGADPSIRNFLIMKEPKDISELMALPLARGESKLLDTQFVGMVGVGVPAASGSSREQNGRDYDEASSKVYEPGTSTDSTPHEEFVGATLGVCEFCGLHNCNELTNDGCCPAYGRECWRCNELDHFARMCPF